MVPSMTKVFVHGNPEVAAIWSPLVEHLALREVEDVVLLSPPGFGAPVAADWRATMSAYVDWLGTEVEAIGGPVDLVGGQTLMHRKRNDVTAQMLLERKEVAWDRRMPEAPEADRRDTVGQKMTPKISRLVGEDREKPRRCALRELGA